MELKVPEPLDTNDVLRFLLFVWSISLYLALWILIFSCPYYCVVLCGAGWVPSPLQWPPPFCQLHRAPATATRQHSISPATSSCNWKFQSIAKRLCVIKCTPDRTSTLGVTFVIPASVQHCACLYTGPKTPKILCFGAITKEDIFLSGPWISIIWFVSVTVRSGHGKWGKVYLVSGHLAPSLLALGVVQQDIIVGSRRWGKMAHFTGAERAKC